MTKPSNQLAMFLGKQPASSNERQAEDAKWSDQQLAIFKELREGSANLAVRARAGTGKTTVAIELLKRTNARGQRVLYCAFNRGIADNVKPRLAGMKNVDVKTFHGMGATILYQHDPATQLDKDKGMTIAREVAPPNAPQKFVTAIKKAASYFKANMIDDVEAGEEALAQMEIDADPHATERELAQLALLVMHASEKMTGLVDFDDQVWLPMKLGLRSKYGYDVVVADEAQDMNESQFRLVLSIVKEHGRIVLIGDEKQAIYAFRGADMGTFDRLIARTIAKVLPLTRTYRCAKAIVREAIPFVPDFEAIDTAPDGTVLTITPEEMRKLMKPGDFVLSRSNAALVKQCTAAIKHGIKSNIQGRDLGEQLAGLIRKSQAEDVEDLIEYVEAWKVKEIEKCQKKDRDEQPVIDRAECLLAFADGAKSIGEVLRNIALMFDDARNDTHVMFSTTHRAKGLERERVFVLQDTYLKRRPVKDENGVPEFIVTEEEKNIFYVAITRAKAELFYVVGAA